MVLVAPAVGNVVPVDRVCLVPLGGLTPVAAHEEQLLAGVGEHVAEEGAKACGLVPVIARHALPERAFAVDYFIVAKRQDILLGKRVHQGERDLVVVIRAVNRIEGEVLQRVVHPAHVPLQ